MIMRKENSVDKDIEQLELSDTAGGSAEFVPSL